MNRRWTAGIALSVATMVVAAVVAVGAQPAHAASSCTKSNQPVTDFLGTVFGYRYYCSTYVGSPVYWNVHTGTAESGYSLDDSGYMYAASSVWVVCQFEGRTNPVIQGNSNDWWLYTQGDSSRSNRGGFTSAWGYLPATAVSQGGQWQKIPGVPECALRAVDYSQLFSGGLSGAVQRAFEDEFERGRLSDRVIGQKVVGYSSSGSPILYHFPSIRVLQSIVPSWNPGAVMTDAQAAADRLLTRGIFS